MRRVEQLYLLLVTVEELFLSVPEGGIPRSLGQSDSFGGPPVLLDVDLLAQFGRNGFVGCALRN